MNTILPQEIRELLKDSDALMPAIAQDSLSGEVLMLAYVNAESLALTIESGFATYFSRSRNQIWKKGETSGHLQKLSPSLLIVTVMQFSFWSVKKDRHATLVSSLVFIEKFFQLAMQRAMTLQNESARV